MKENPGAKIDEYLQKLKTKHHNPGKNNDFFLYESESYIYVDSYFVLDVEIIFRKERILIHFFEKDRVLGCAILTRIISSDYGFDPDIRAIIGKEEFGFSKEERKNRVDLFERFFNLIEEGKDVIEVELVYVKENAARFHSQNIIFIEDRDHDTFYYLHKEYYRREKSK